MITELDVYKSFRSVQSSIKGSGYRLPKDWVKFFTERLTVNQQQNLTRASKYFSTAWESIDMNRYFECGFELFPKFSYHMFFNDKVMQLYIRRDKIIKADIMNMKSDIINSSKFVYHYMQDKEYANLFSDYCMLSVDEQHVMIDHYMKNKVTGYFVSWMIAEGNFNVYAGGYESTLTHIVKNYRTMLKALTGERWFLDSIKDKLSENRRQEK